MTLHLKFTAFIELYSTCHTSLLSYCAALFSSIIFAPAPPIPASLQQIVNHHNWCLLFILLYIFHNATDFVNWREEGGKIVCGWNFKQLLHIILHIYILTEQIPYHLQNMHSFWKLLKSCRAKKSFGTFYRYLLYRVKLH